MRTSTLTINTVSVKDAVLRVVLGLQDSTTVILTRRADWQAEQEALWILNEFLSEMQGFLFGRLGNGQEAAIAEWWFVRKDGKFVASWLFSDGYMIWLLTNAVADDFKPTKDINILKEALFEVGVYPYWLLSYNKELLKEV